MLLLASSVDYDIMFGILLIFQVRIEVFLCDLPNLDFVLNIHISLAFNAQKG